MKILIFGNGYVGQRCKIAWPEAIHYTEKVHSVEDALLVLNQVQPDAVLNAAGVTGKPNVDWCEDHQLETIYGNVTLPVYLAQACQEQSVYLLHIGTGCIFYGKSPNTQGWKEADFANPISVYSKSKYACDLLLSTLPNVGIARIRLPIESVPSPKNTITKLASYSTIIDVENSLTVVEEMVDVFKQLLEKKAPGIFHCTQPGKVTYRDLIELYRKYIDPTIQKEWITEDELTQRGLGAKMRATNFLQSENLEKVGIHMTPISQILETTMQKYAAHVMDH